MAALAAGCGTATSSQRSGPSEPERLEMEPVKIQATRSGDGFELQSFDAPELFEAGETAAENKRPIVALGHFLKLTQEFPESSLVPAATFNAGIAMQDSGDWSGAARQFGRYADRFPQGPDIKDALFLRGISLAEAGEWDASEDLFSAVLERTDLTPDDRVEAMTRRGVARLNKDDLEAAEAAFRNAFAYKRQLDMTAEARLETDYYLALAQYLMAQISHRRSNAVALTWPQAQMSLDLERKATLLLEARRRYIEAVRYGNPQIASMAAFQIGTLFQEFYDSVIAVPAPPELDGQSDDAAARRSVYFDELKKKLKNVLAKSLRGHEHNLELFERLGVETAWVAKSRDAIERLRALLDPENSPDTPGSEASAPEDSVPSGADSAPTNPTPERPDNIPEKPLPSRQIL